MIEQPSEICAECRAVLGDNWIADFWLYCPHSRVMARRRSRADAWTLDRNVKPAKARKHIEAAGVKMAAWCAQNGYDFDMAMTLVQALTEKQRADDR